MCKKGSLNYEMTKNPWITEKWNKNEGFDKKGKLRPEEWLEIKTFVKKAAERKKETDSCNKDWRLWQAGEHRAEKRVKIETMNEDFCTKGSSDFRNDWKKKQNMKFFTKKGA